MQKNPNDAEIFKRFKEQGVLSDEEIQRAMDNTNVTLSFEDIHFTKDIKLPILPKYRDKTKEEREKIYSKLITKQFKKYTKGMDADTYQKEVKLADGTKIVINSVFGVEIDVFQINAIV